jgi:pimeloyl-ACP methyl ester carboxylesterase
MIQTLKIITIVLLGGYALICLLLYLGQRSMIYHPQARSLASVPLMQMMSESYRLNISYQPKASERAVIYFGGNAEDVSMSSPELSAAFPDAAVYGLHYRGYGGSEGKPSQQALYADALALHAIVQKQHRQIVVIGRSLGSGVATYLASQRAVERLILVTPYSSIADIAAAQFPWIPVRWLLKDPFESAEHAARCRVPIRIISAQHDEVIPAWSTQRLFEAIPPALASQHVIAGVGHNDISLSALYQEVLRRP